MDRSRARYRVKRRRWARSLLGRREDIDITDSREDVRDVVVVILVDHVVT